MGRQQHPQRIAARRAHAGASGAVFCDSRQVADAARALRNDLKVRFITGYAENAVLSHGHLDSGMQVLTKPFSMDELTLRVKKILGR